MLKFFKDEFGAALVEYGLLVGLIAIVAIGAIQGLGSSVKSVFDHANTALSTVVTAS